MMTLAEIVTLSLLSAQAEHDPEALLILQDAAEAASLPRPRSCKKVADWRYSVMPVVFARFADQTPLSTRLANQRRACES